MNKENGIKRLNRLSAQAKEYRDEDTRVVKLSTAIEIIELLDEPKPLTEDQAWKVIADVYNQDADRWEDAKNHYLNSLKEKPVVKQFVADWFDLEKHDLENAIYRYVVYCNKQQVAGPFNDWFSNYKNMPIETLIKMKNGYEVEKEPLFHMPVPYLEDAYYRNDDLKELTSFKKYSKFTQTELDERFPDIKHMAEEVQE